MGKLKLLCSPNAMITNITITINIMFIFCVYLFTNILLLLVVVVVVAVVEEVLLLLWP